MAASDSAFDTPRRQDGESANRTTLLTGLGIAVAIVVAAVLIGSRSGWDAVGGGGVNRALLPKVGTIAPDFVTEDVYGNPVRLSQFRGQPVWLMFWGSWCPPCRAEFPDLQAAYAQLAPRGLRMLGVSLRESPLDAASYAARNGATFLVLSDPDESDTGAAYPVLNFPTHIFIDRDGIIRSIVFEDMDTQQAIAEANRLLADDASPAAAS
jgi:cytochrome c biogenesis protein CcmG, thiol:disulfide interchange protein DsbE